MFTFLFDPLLAFPPVLAVTIFSVLILFLINIFYRILINQNTAKQIKERSKELNKKMKEEQKAGNKEQVNKMMSEMMSENSRLMRLTMKPMLVSLIIVIVFLPWLSTAYGDHNIAIKDGEGALKIKDVEYAVQMSGNDVTVNPGQIQCTGMCEKKINGVLYEIRPETDKVIFAPIVAMLPVSLPFIGSNVGWLGWYIICSIPFVMILRKLMKIYV